MLWIVNGTVYTMREKQPIRNGCVGICDGKIIYVGASREIPADAQVLDAEGGVIMPGIVEAHCHIGISEEKKGMEGDDCNENTDAVTPWLRATDGINPMDPAFHEAIKAGITSVMAGSGSANVVGGQFAFLKTHGRSITEMLVREPAAMKISFGENPKCEYGPRGIMPSTRMGIGGLLREQLYKAKEYQRQRESKADFFRDFRMEPWLPVLEREIPMKAHVHRADDILTAIRIAKEFDLRLTLDHCTEGHLIVDEIKESGFPAICGPHLANRNKLEIQNADFKTPGILSKAGILTALTTDHPVSLIQFLPICSALAVKKGMEEAEALRAITVNAAKICQVDDRVGSLAEGMDGDVVVFDGSPLKLETEVLFTVINGEVVYQRRES